MIRFTALAIISAPSRTLSNKLSHLLNVSLILKFCDNFLAAAGRSIQEGSWRIQGEPVCFYAF